MRLSKIVILNILVTIIALVFVYQKIEIINTGYNIGKNKIHLKKLIDENEILRYNVVKYSSPQYLNKKIKEFSINLELPKRIKIVKSTFTPVSEYAESEESKGIKFIKRGKSFLSRLFLPRAKAETKIPE